MADPHQNKPVPARGEHLKPTPVREMNGVTAAVRTESDVPEAHLRVGDALWTVRVLGRSARASGSAPPLLLLGFWEEGGAADGPSLEAMVVGRALEALSPDALEEALSAASVPRDPDRTVPFFPDAGQVRRR